MSVFRQSVPAYSTGEHAAEMRGTQDEMLQLFMCFACQISEFHLENALVVAGSGISSFTSVGIWHTGLSNLPHFYSGTLSCLCVYLMCGPLSRPNASFFMCTMCNVKNTVHEFQACFYITTPWWLLCFLQKVETEFHCFIAFKGRINYDQTKCKPRKWKCMPINKRCNSQHSQFSQAIASAYWYHRHTLYRFL